MKADEFEQAARMAIGGVIRVLFENESMTIGRARDVTYFVMDDDSDSEGKEIKPRDTIVGVSRIGNQVLISTRKEVAHIDPSKVVAVNIYGHPDIALLDELRKNPDPGNYL